MKQFSKMSVSTRDAIKLRRSASFAIGALMVALVLPIDAAWGRGKPPPAPPPSPDIVYTSYASNAPSSPAIRGVTLASDGLSGTDTQLAKAKADRDSGSIVWSPDGTRYAWVEGAWQQTRSIMVAAPGQSPTVVYSAAYGTTDPYPSEGGADVLDWGVSCAGTSVLVFSANGLPPSQGGIWAIFDPELTGAGHIPQLLSSIENASGLALSPTGEHLAFRYWSTNERVWMLPMCSIDKTPVVLVEKAAIGAADDPCIDPSLPYDPVTNSCEPDSAIISIDWSRHGDRLALSVTVGPDPNYPWRDLKIVYLDYALSAAGVETVAARASNPVFTVNLDNDSRFGAASSEHSPRWGPSELGGACQRIAFSQSAGASDGSTTTGRNLYLLDVNANGIGSCQINTPRLLSSKTPRALDWK
jgi:hypothetical protein